MTPWLARDGFGEAPIVAIVFDSRRIVGGVGHDLGYARRMGLRAVISTSTSRSRSRGRTSARRGISGSAGGTAWSGSDPFDEARRAAFATLERGREMEHDEEISILFTERIMEGMGGVGDTYACAAEMTHAWEHAHHFDLFDDVPPTLEALRARGLGIGLLSNTAFDFDLFVEHHGFVIDAVLTSRAHGKTKPHEAIFLRMLELLDVAAGDAAMVGDTIEDDIEGARAVGMTAVLINPEGRHSDVPGRIDDLRALPVALGLD